MGKSIDLKYMKSGTSRLMYLIIIQQKLDFVRIGNNLEICMTFIWDFFLKCIYINYQIYLYIKFTALMKFKKDYDDKQ